VRLLGDRAHINVTSFNRQVLLISGEVPSAQARQTAGRADRGARVENVRSVVNELRGDAAHSSLGQRSNDYFHHRQGASASLVDSKDLSASAFKVSTERNVRLI
jgi:osmotically-inducible protein OsmY